MSERIAKIESTFLGYEDHLTAYLNVSYGSATSQGIGGRAFDRPDGSVARIGTAYGMEAVARIIRACGVDSWEKVKGRTILVYFSDDGVRIGGMPVGIGPLPTENGVPFYFDDIKAMADA